MKQRYSYFFLVVFIMLGFNTIASAQNLAQEAYTIFEQACLICHGENGAYRESLIIEHNVLIENGKIIPGDPESSVFYQRLIETNVAKRMPLEQPPLSAEAIETIRHRSHAIYWDEKNNVGETVASGVYFYTLTAGNFTAARKMLILK